jgi:hypothetical protein
LQGAYPRKVRQGEDFKGKMKDFEIIILECKDQQTRMVSVQSRIVRQMSLQKYFLCKVAGACVSGKDLFLLSGILA